VKRARPILPRCARLAGAVALAALLSLAQAEDGRLRLRSQGADLFLQVEGDEDDDWHIQGSTDLVTWSNLTELGTLLSGDTNAPWRAAGGGSDPVRFFRTLKTAGLYDPTLLRTVSLTFTQNNWQSLLTSGRTTGSNTPASLTLDNGAAQEGVGARYRGNSSFTGFGGGAPVKKSINLEIDHTLAGADVMGYDTLNLNNAYGDETIMREPLYFHVMHQYAVCPQASLAKLYINGSYWGVYSFVQQQNGDLIRQWFPSNDGDRWRAPNMGGGGGPGGGAGGGNSALSYLGTNVSAYRSVYELKTQNSTNAWQRLIQATYVLNKTPAAQLRDQVEDVLAVDRWLWFLVLENVFADDDSYFNKGADYMFYYEPESGRLHPVEHDGNESFFASDARLSPVQGATSTNRPVLNRLLSIPELRQRYLAHMRTVLEESYNPTVMLGLIDHYHALSQAAIAADTRKGYTMASYTNDLNTLRAFVQQRYAFLTNHAELRPAPPTITAVTPPAVRPTAAESPVVTAEVHPHANEGLSSVWLYHRGKSYGRFAVAEMFDDGAHGDGDANDGVFGAATTTYPAGTKVRFYVEARSGNATQTACFAPPRAEEQTCSYRVALTTAASSPVVINELMASNTTALADPQGEYDDWLELRNLTDQLVDLTGRYLSDEPNNPRKWAFPAGTTIAPNGFLLVWADEDGSATAGLHASFKLDADGEELYLTDTDANLNAILDSVIFGLQSADRSYGRTAADADVWAELDPTPGRPNP
jgi:hypothetical protein